MKTLSLAFLSLAVLVAQATATGDECTVTVDFNTFPNGTSTNGGEYVDEEWLDYGFTLTASGGLSNKPRLFDTSTPGTNKFGDPDLGSPNKRCSPSGPGKGEGGEPGSPGANCEPLGNVLIIQEENTRPDIPDDNVDGGIITFHFDKPQRVAKIGLLDIDYKSFLTVTTLDSSPFDIAIPMLGDNSVQTVNIDTEQVVQLDLNLSRSGAVTFLSFCYTDDLLKVGEVCYGGGCETDYCFNAVLPGGITPAGVCSCNPTTNAGCTESEEECAFSPLVDIGPPGCFLPTGASCLSDTECVSDHCYEGECVCNEELNFPCQDNESCTFEEGSSSFACLLKIGEVCYGGGCETDYCFNAVLPGGITPAGVCSCNPTTNAGCTESEEECAFSPLVVIGPPGCFLPMGASCLSDTECVSDHCYEGECVCNEELNFPCKDNESCIFEEGSTFVCRALLKSINEPCLDPSECESGYCWAEWYIVPEEPGYCRCNPNTSEGCPDGMECLFPWVSEAAPDCFLPEGSTCSDNAECFSGSCFNNKCAACDAATQYPCEYFGQLCTFKEGSGYACRSGSLVGLACSEDTECITGVCWKAYPPLSPGVCECIQDSNEGCSAGEECAVRPGSINSPLSCYVPMGAWCFADSDCLSEKCDDRVCVCNDITNYPCADDETCRIEDSQFACQKCILPDPVGSCYSEIPVVCPDGCEYPDRCLASEAGYLPRRDCRYSNEFVSGPSGNLYKAFEKLFTTWTAANADVQALVDACGVTAHLATVTSLEEDIFIHELGRQFHSYDTLPQSFWIGGFQNVDSPLFEEPGGGWEWQNNEGPIPTTTHPISGKYENWGAKEPNDFRNQPTNTEHLPENHMTVCRFDVSPAASVGKATGWNDEFLTGPIRGYIVEVEVKTLNIYGCDSKVENLRLPPLSDGCPPGPISSLIEGCAEYIDITTRNDDFLQCVTQFTTELVHAGLITSEESNRIRACIPAID